MSNQELESVFQQISNDPQANDVVGNTAPQEVSQADLQAISESLQEEDAARRTKFSNESYPTHLLAKGVNAPAWVSQKYGKLKPDNRKNTVPPQLVNREFPIKVSENPSVPWDGYRIQTPEGTEDIRKDDALAWLLNNTLGRAVGHPTQTLRIKQDKNISANSKKKPLSVKKTGLSASNPDHVIPTYVQATKEDGTPATITKSVTLDTSDVSEEEAVSLRGYVQDFPKFERAEEFIKALGTINPKSSGGGSAKIHEGVDQKDAIAEWVQFMAIARQDDLI